MWWRLINTLLISATQPCWEVAWSNQAIRSCANTVPKQAHCKLSLYSSALLWAFVHEQFWTVSLGTPANELQDFLWHLGQCVMWLRSSYMLKRQGSLCNLKLLAEMVGYGVSAPVIKFFHSKKGKVLPSSQCQRAYILWAQHSSCGHRTAQCVALNQTSPHICIWHSTNLIGTFHSVLWVIWGFRVTWHCAIGTRTAPKCQWCFKSLTFLL